MKKFCSVFICIILFVFPVMNVSAEVLIAEKPPRVDALAAIVMDMDSGRVLYENNAGVKRAMASTTKIMTAIVALEKSELDEIVTVSRKAAIISGSSMNLKQDEKIIMKYLLYGLLLNSGNDAAIAIAEHIGGSVEGFAEIMNQKAKEIGAFDTAFVTPHGLDADGHYTTAYDLANITRYALKIPVFNQIVRTPSIIVGGRSLRNTNEMLSLYNGADGVKTGFTGQAGRCLVTSATRENMRLISVVLGCPTKTKRTDASKKLLDFVFRNFDTHNLLNDGEEFGEINVIKGVAGTVKVISENGVRMPLSDLEIQNLKINLDIPASLEAPVEKGVSVGTVKYLVNENILAEVTLLTQSAIRRKNALDYIDDIVRIWVGILKGWSVQ